MSTRGRLCPALYCHLCGYGSDWAKPDASNLKKHMVRKHGTSEVCVGTHLDPLLGRTNTWRPLDAANPDLIVCLKSEGSGTDAVYCLDCHHIEQMIGTGNPLVRFATHECPTPRGQSKLKGTKRVKATEPATGGAGVSTPAPPAKGLFVPFDWISARTEQDMEGYGLPELENEFKAANLCHEFQKAAKAAAVREAEAMKQLAAVKAAAPVAASATMDLSTAAQMVADSLCSDSKVGRIVRAEKAELEKDAAEDLDLDPLDYEPYTPYRLLVELASTLNSWRVECKRARDKLEESERTVQMRDAEIARLKVENHRIIQNYTYCERDKAVAEERVRVLEKALVAAKEQAPTPA